MGFFSGGAVGAMVHSLKQNQALRLKRRSLKDVRNTYHNKSHILEKPKFKKASPEEMRVLKLKLEREKDLNFKKKVIVVLILFSIGILAMYFLDYG